MAKKTQTELLEGILLLLDQTLGETKKKNKAVGDSNAPKGAGVVNAKDISVKAVGDALSVISSAVPKLAKISEKEYDTIAKGIEKLASAISSFKMDKDSLAAIGNTISAFVQIHNVISGMSENFIKSILSLNRAKAFILGRRLGRFYGILAKNMTSEFIKQMVDIINQVPPNKNVHSKTFKERLVNFGLMMAALLQIKEKQIMQLWMMGVFLGPKNGAAIGGFFKALIDSMIGKNKDAVKKAEAAAKMTLSIAALVGTLTLCLVALVILWKTNTPEDLIGGAKLLLGVVTFSLIIIGLLGSKWFKREKNEGLQGTKDVLLLIGGLTLSLAVLVLVAKKTRWQDMIQGIMMLSAVMTFALAILLVLGKNSFKKDALEGLESIGEITLLILGMTASLAIVTYVAKKTRWQDMVQGIIMLGAVVAFALGIIWVLSRDSFQKNAIKGLAGVGAVVLLIAGSSAAMLIFAEYVKKIDGVKKESAQRAFKLMWAVIGGMVALAAIIGAIWSTGIGAGAFAAAFIGVEMIAAMIASVSGAILLFVELIEKTKALTKDDISTAYDRIIGKGANDTESLVGCLVSIVNAIDDNIRWKAAPKIAAIGLALRPVISAISQFVDVVQKMASLQVADKWDKNGNPIHYLKLEPSKFKEAAENLTGAFSTFLTDLSKGLKGFDEDSMDIIQSLFPRQSGISKFFTGEKPSIGVVIRTLSDFVDVIQKMASMSVPDKWNKDGNPISYRKLDPEKDFKAAAVNLSSAFSTFLTELGNGLKGLGFISTGILAIVGKDLGSVLQGVGAAFGPIIQIAAGKIQVGDKVVDIDKTKLKDAASTVVSILTDIINFLGHSKAIAEADWNADKFKDTMVDFIDGIRDIDILHKIVFNKDNNVNNLISGLNIILDFLGRTKAIAEADWNADKFKDTLEDFCDGVKYLNIIKKEMFLPEFDGNTTNLTNGLNEIVKYLNDTNFRSAKSNSTMFNETMKNTAAGINHIKPFLSSTPKQIVDLANAMKQLDAELIAKEEQRTKAIQSVASNFKDMAEGVNQLNKAMAESMRLTRLYDQMKSVTSGNIIAKGVSAAVEGAGAVASKVKEALNDNKSEEQQKAKEEAKQKDREDLAAIIGNAVSAALTAWSESHRDLTVQFSDSPEKIFGEVYHN